MIANTNRNVEKLLQECNITLEKQRIIDLENQKKLQDLTDKVESIKEWVNSKNLLTKEEFAQLCGVKPGTIHKRFNEGLYEIPEGRSERAYYNQGNQGNQLFVIPLAMEYYEINLKK